MRKILSLSVVMLFYTFLATDTNAQTITVTINQSSAQADPTSNLSINFTAVFSKPVAGFTSSDVSLSGSTVPATTIVVNEIAPNDGTTFNVAVSGMPLSGIVVASVPAGAAMDDLSQSSQASTSTDNTVTYQLVCEGVCPENLTKTATSPSGAIVEYGPIRPPTPVCGGTIGLPFSGSIFPVGTTTVNVYDNVSTEEFFYGLIHNQLYRINSGNPSIMTGPTSITGLQSGESIVSIDFRPSTGQLYGLGIQNCVESGTIKCARVYTINKTTGVATQIGISSFSLHTPDHEIEFDPVTDMIHIIGGTYQEHHVMDPDTGGFTFDGYGEGSAGFKGIAFSNNQPSATFTTLYGLTTDNILYTIGGINGVPPPGLNSVFAVGELNADPNNPDVNITSERTSFDISSGGHAIIITGGNVMCGVDLFTGYGSSLGILSTALDDIAIEPLALTTPACSFTVTVNPPEPCTVTCPENITTDAISSSGAVVNYNLSTTGLCGTITSLPASGSTFPIGTTIVNVYENYSQKVYALLDGNALLSFDIASPGLVSGIKFVTGLVQVPDGENLIFEDIVAIDFRSSNGKLYGLGVMKAYGTAQLYTIDTVTGVAAAVGNVFNVNSNSSYSIDFNPVSDELRIVVGAFSNLRIDPDLGTIIASEPLIDPVLTISGIAYTNSASSATSTTLFDLSPETNSLYRQGGIDQTDAANNGKLTLVGALGQDFTSAGFDITQAGVGIASLFTTVGSAPFYKIDLATGTSTYINNIAIGGGTFVQDIAAAPLAITPSCSFTVTVNAPQPPTITCPANVTAYVSSETCTAEYTFSPGSFTITGSPVPVISVEAKSPQSTFTFTGLTGDVKTFMPAGVYTVKATVTNDFGTSSCTYTLTVSDNTPPLVECQQDITVAADPGLCSAKMNLRFRITEMCSLPISYSIDGTTGVFNFTTISAGFEKTYPVGTRTVNAVFTDASGNSSSCTFQVTVLDNEKPVITNCPSAVSVSCAAQVPAANISSVTATDNCGTPTITHVGDVISNQICANKYTITRTYKATDGSGNTATCSQTITVDDITPPTITGLTPSKRILAPPNHKMVDVTLAYTVNDNCVSTPNVTVSITSNEPINGTGDGDTDPDWQVVDGHHIRLRAERSGQGTGRIYTITVTVNDGCNAPVSATTEVMVVHNITGPHSGNSFKVGSTVAFTGEFWDVPGNKHTAKWSIDGTSISGIVTEPAGTKNGKVTGSYKFTTPGVYKLQMNITDQKGVTTYANTNGDLEAIVVIYDPNGGYTYGGGYYNSPAGALVSNPSSTGKVSYGFAMNYFKNSTNPKGETQFEFKVGEFEFNALNFDYLVISNSMAQFKGTGKIIGGQSGIGFTMTVVDGQLDGTGLDKIRMKIYNKNNGRIIYDNLPGASDAALPIAAVGANSVIVIQGTSANPATTKTSSTQVETESKSVGVDELTATVYSNPASNHFNIMINSNDAKEKIVLQVLDQYGRVIEVRNNVSVGSTVRLGDLYRSGVYYVSVIQGKQRKELKLVKLN